MIVVSYFTNGEYAGKAERLRASLDRLGIRHDIHKMPDQGSWQKNTFMKPTFIRQKLYQHGVPVVWVDADAVVLRPLDIFLAPLFRIAVYRYSPVNIFIGSEWHNRGQLWNGTAYFADTEYSRGILISWACENDSHPERLDQKNLATVLAREEDTTDLACLPPEYCWVEEWMRRFNKNAEPVIVHEAVWSAGVSKDAKEKA